MKHADQSPFSMLADTEDEAAYESKKEKDAQAVTRKGRNLWNSSWEMYLQA